MTAVQLADGELNYLLEGPAQAPVLVLSNSLGTDLHMWDAQMAAFTEHFRVLRYDTRGHGQSLVTEGPYSIEQSGRDVLALQRAVLCNTAAKIGNPDVWNPRIETVLRDGAAAMLALRDGSIARWFTPAFAAAQPSQVEPIVGMLAQTSPQGYAANCAAVRDADFREQLAGITLPVLVVCGSEDAVTTPADGRFMVDRICGAELVELHAAHLSNVEAGALFSSRVLDFLLA